MKKRFQDLLHRYKVEAFKISHNHDQIQEITQEILTATEEALNNAYTYHFHKDPDPERIEMINTIKNYTLEAIMPPIIEKVMRRVTVLEKQHEELINMVGELLEVLSDENASIDGASSNVG